MPAGPRGRATRGSASRARDRGCPAGLGLAGARWPGGPGRARRAAREGGRGRRSSTRRPRGRASPRGGGRGAHRSGTSCPGVRVQSERDGGGGESASSGAAGSGGESARLTDPCGPWTPTNKGGTTSAFACCSRCRLRLTRTWSAMSRAAGGTPGKAPGRLILRSSSSGWRG